MGNTKELLLVNIDSIDHFKCVQKVLISLGYTWSNSSKFPRVLDKKSLPRSIMTDTDDKMHCIFPNMALPTGKPKEVKIPLCGILNWYEAAMNIDAGLTVTDLEGRPVSISVTKRKQYKLQLPKSVEETYLDTHLAVGALMEVNYPDTGEKMLYSIKEVKQDKVVLIHLDTGSTKARNKQDLLTEVERGNLHFCSVQKIQIN